jgi:hypothetical protein
MAKARGAAAWPRDRVASRLNCDGLAEISRGFTGVRSAIALLVRRRAVLRGMRCGSTWGGACGHRQGSLGRGVGRGRRRGKCPGRDGQVRGRAHGRLSALGAARRPRPAHARTTRLWPAGAVHGDQGGAGVGRALAAGPRAHRRRDEPPLGGVRSARRPARAHRACRGVGEPRLRAAELESGQAVASARLGDLPDGRPRLRRPDLVLFPDAALPVAVEVELSVKASRRLQAICRAWARCRLVSEVRYYSPPHVSRARFPAPFPSCRRTVHLACHARSGLSMPRTPPSCLLPAHCCLVI